MTLPNFLFIGTGKAGSTSLYYYLKQHPEIYMSPIKETNFFAYEGGRPNFCGPGDLESMAHKMTITNIDDYKKNFRGVTTEKSIGEVSPSYLYLPEAPKRIKAYIPNAKMIVILRNPIDRAYSAFAGYIKSGREPLSSFYEAIAEEKHRIHKNWSPSWHYIQNGFYYEQLQRYFSIFPKEQLKIYLFEDWRTDAKNLMKDIFSFIEVSEEFKVDISGKYNISGKPKYRSLYNFMREANTVKSLLRPLVPPVLRKNIVHQIQSFNLDKLPEIPQDIRHQLIEVYRHDILNLQELIQRDLSNWLCPASLLV